MRFCITSFFVYSDRLFLYHLVYLSLPLYLLSLIFTSRSLRAPSIISSIHILLFNLFCTLLLCSLKSFWLSYSLPQSKFQSSRFFYAYSLSLYIYIYIYIYLSTPQAISRGMSHSLPLSLSMSTFATTLSCSSDLYQSNFSILFYLTPCLCLSLSKSIIFVFFGDFFLSIFLFFLSLHPTIFFSLKPLLYLITSLSPFPTSLSLHISNIFSQWIPVSPITFVWLSLWSCSCERDWK